MLVQITTGNETFRNGSVKVYGFWRRTGGGAELPLYQAARDTGSGVKSIGRPDFIQASQVNINSGQWVTARYDVPEGSFLKLQVQRKSSGEVFYRSHMTFLMFRKEAALRKMRIEFTGNDQANVMCGYIEGNFDIVKHENYETLGLDMGRFSDQFDSDPDDFYSVEIIEREVRPWSPVKLQEVKTDKGTVHVPVQGSRRVIRTRR